MVYELQSGSRERHRRKIERKGEGKRIAYEGKVMR